MISMERGKQITINQLAEMMNTSFIHLEYKIDNLDRKMDKRFDNLKKVVNGHENRISHLEDDVRVLKTKAEK